MLPAPPLLGGCEGPHSLLQVSVSVKPGTVVAKELFALFEGYLALLDAFGNPYFELPYEFLRGRTVRSREPRPRSRRL